MAFENIIDSHGLAAIPSHPRAKVAEDRQSQLQEEVDGGGLEDENTTLSTFIPMY